MTFDQIQSFYWVATLGTYRLAAEKQNATQPAISARIKALEATLGTALFDRSGQRVAMTPHGRHFLRYAEMLLEMQGRALREIGQTSPVTGTIRIGASDTIAVTWFPQFISYLTHKYPAAFFEVHVEVSRRLHESLIQRQIDLAFMVGPVSHPELTAIPLCSYPSGLVVSPSMGLPPDKLFTVDEVAEMVIFTFDRQTRPHQDLKAVLLDSRASAFRINPVNTLQAIILLVQQGLGLGYLQLGAAEKELASGGLRVLKTDFDLPDTGFCVAYPALPRSTTATQIAHDARDFLRQQTCVNSISLLF